MAPAPAWDSVYTEYARSLIAFKARKLSKLAGADEDDIAQELMTCLFRKSHLFDPRRASPNTFAAIVIESAVAMWLRGRRALKRAAELSAQSIDRDLIQEGRDLVDVDDLLTTDLGGRSEPHVSDRIADTERLAAVIDAYQALPPALQDVAFRLTTDKVFSIAKKLGISRRQIGNAVARIREHFADAGLENFLG